MPENKRPFHEVVSEQIASASNRALTPDLMDESAAQLGVLLSVLHDSKMPATAAHKIAKDHANLPELVHRIGGSYLGTFATNVLSDLQNREDEKK